MAPAVVITIDLLPDTSAPGRSTAFLVLTAFLLTFAFIRTSARLIRNPRVTWWPGNVETGGLHIHHLVWGICLVLVSGFLGFAADLQTPVVAHLGHRLRDRRGPDDRRVRAVAATCATSTGPSEGRLSVDAAVLATVFAVLVVLGTKPFGLDDPGSVLATVLLFLEAVVLSGRRVPQGPLPHRRRRALRPLLGARWPPSAWPSPTRPGRRWRYRGPRADKLGAAPSGASATDRRAAELGDRLVTFTTGLSEPEPSGGGTPDGPRLSRSRPSARRGGALGLEVLEAVARAPGRARSRPARARRATSARCP